jgi:hypothetical protein
VDRREKGEHRAAEEDVVDVGDDEVRIVVLRIDRRRGVHDAAEATDDEHRDEADGE